MVIRCLETGPRRFTELRVPLPAITPKVLSGTLRAMERDGLLTRTPYDENPPRVEYALILLGRTLIPLLDTARVWSGTHLPQPLAARQDHEHDAPAAPCRMMAVCDSKRSPGTGSATSSPTACST
ncbi:winged helix-turn-helix transcriptional regulator [Streptomyces dysideae]|uniref:winged helix-turn-helix transcriptional regulator n=1 Tax=Streptomyces dysideae TaxID=909626 RepID=UPI001F20B827|nr:helix-turn-helix domain-containing protein [Streptomyces dysideae]